LPLLLHLRTFVIAPHLAREHYPCRCYHDYRDGTYYQPMRIPHINLTRSAAELNALRARSLLRDRLPSITCSASLIVHK
jgi:hypothetical protein